MWEAILGLAESHPGAGWEKTAEAFFKKRDEAYRKHEANIGGSIIYTFKETNPQTPFIILVITDIVLITISFMIILLYKKD